VVDKTIKPKEECRGKSLLYFATRQYFLKLNKITKSTKHGFDYVKIKHFYSTKHCRQCEERVEQMADFTE
jgi:hypothetical protein